MPALPRSRGAWQWRGTADPEREHRAMGSDGRHDREPTGRPVPHPGPPVLHMWADAGPGHTCVYTHIRGVGTITPAPHSPHWGGDSDGHNPATLLPPRTRGRRMNQNPKLNLLAARRGRGGSPERQMVPEGGRETSWPGRSRKPDLHLGRPAGACRLVTQPAGVSRSLCRKEN